MPILPSGKKRIMEAQSSLGLGNEWGASGLGTPNTYTTPEDAGSLHPQMGDSFDSQANLPFSILFYPSD